MSVYIPIYPRTHEYRLLKREKKIRNEGNGSLVFILFYFADSLVQSVFLESEDLVLELADGTGLLESQAFGGLLQTTNHGRRTTEKNLDIVGGLGQPFLLKERLVMVLRKKILFWQG